MNNEASMVKKGNVRVHIITHVKASGQRPEAVIVNVDDAKEVGRKLAAKIAAEGIVKIHTSPTTRAVQTAEGIAAGLVEANVQNLYKMRIKNTLAMPDVKSWQKFDQMMADPNIPDAVKKTLWIEGKVGEETMEHPESMLNRLKKAMEFPMYLSKRMNGSGRDVDIVFVTHRAVIEFLCADLVGKDRKEYIKEQGTVGQGDIVTIDLTNKKIAVKDKVLEMK
jgi:broad specificity phosphatase PhoE